MVLGYNLGVSSNMSRLRYGLTSLLLVLPSIGAAERYVVSDDAFGNTTAKQVSELSEKELKELKGSSEASPPHQTDSISAEDKVVGDAAQPTVSNGSAAIAEDDSVKPEQGASGASVSETQISGASVSDIDASQSDISQNNANTEDTPLLSSEVGVDNDKEKETAKTATSSKPDNPFERALRQSQENETDEVIKRLRAQGGDNNFDITEVNPADFVDSEDLLQGNVDSDGDQRFFVTFDSTGESNVIFYSPAVIQQEIDKRKTEERVSEAVVHSPEDAGAKLVLPEGADPAAAKILSSGAKQSYFDRFSLRCCESLPNVGVLTLRKDKSLHVALDRDDFSYRFTDGDSRYGMVRLPDVRKNYLLTIKTFVKSYKKLGIPHGAFIPQIVMMDRDKNITRIISDLSTTSHAETWRSYGYLKSVIEVEQTDIDAEAFLLVYTRASDLRKKSIVEDSSGAWEIKHMEVGSVEVAVVESTL